MSSPEMHVEQDLFASVGVRLQVDTELYGQLLGELSADVVEPVLPTARLFPELSWLRSYTQVDNATYRRVYARTTSGGNYDPDPRLLSVACPPSVQEANETLLHETQHWNQDIHGDLATGQRWLNAALGATATSVVGGLAGVGVGIYLKNPDVIGLSASAVVLPPLGLLWYKAVGSKNERMAYRFQGDPDILRTYGRIISYHAAA